MGIRFPTGRSTGKHGKDLMQCLDANMSFWSKNFWPPIVTRFESPRLQFVNAHWRKGWQDTPQQYRWAQGFCETLKGLMRKSFIRKVCKSFRPRIERVLVPPKLAILNNLLPLISLCYKNYLISLQITLLYLSIENIT